MRQFDSERTDDSLITVSEGTVDGVAEFVLKVVSQDPEGALRRGQARTEW